VLVEAGDEHDIAAGAAVGNPAMHDDDAVVILTRLTRTPSARSAGWFRRSPTRSSMKRK
jgi:hypothetical protein